MKLYTNVSEQSLKSEYEELTPYPDDSDFEDDDDDDDQPPLPNVHQPKAYRDTIAPLLEHQFSTDRLAVPPMPSPMSIASLPQLHHPNASMSVPSLQLTPDISPDLRPTTSNLASLSQTSIQITPEMTPLLPPTDFLQAPSFQQYSTSLRERQIALEVPDVREADSWYDQPLSPVSPEELSARLRDSQLSAVSPYGGEGYQRQLTYESLAPPIAQKSPNLRPVSYIEDYSPGPVSATLTHVVDDPEVPPPLDLAVWSSTAVSKISGGSAPVHQPEIDNEYYGDEPRSQHASLMVNDPIEGPMRTYLTPPLPKGISDMSSTVPKEKPDLEEIYRPGSAFSDSSEPPSPETLGGQLKAVFKFKKKKKDKKSDDMSSKRNEAKPRAIRHNGAPAAPQDDLDSYRYPYWKPHQSLQASELAPPHRLRSPDLNSIRSSQSHLQEMRRLSAISGPGPSISSSPQPPEADLNATGKTSPRPPIKRREPQAAIPLTNYQKYGPEIWNEKDKKKKQKEAEKATKQAEKAAAKLAKAGVPQDPPLTPDARLNSFLDYAGKELEGDKFYPSEQRHSRPASSRAYSHMKTTSGETNGSRPSTDAASTTSSRHSGGLAGYNNDLFEASGGAKKKNKLASRLMMSSEEKRKLKVKESITIVGGQKLPGAGPSRTSEGGKKGLVRI